MRYELKHDKLAAQIFLRASAAAKARRRAEEVYAFYTEIASKRLLTAEELDYLGPFATVLQVPEELGQAMEKGREKIREKEWNALRKAQEQAAMEKQLKEAALVNEQRAKRRTNIASITSIIALGLALLAGWNYKIAEAAKLETESAKDKVEKALAEKEKLEFLDKEKRARIIIDAGGCPEDLIREMQSIAFAHRDSLIFKKKIFGLIRKQQCK
jgi:hypothetical protein